MLEYTDKISIETTHNVRLDYEVASVVDRVLAWLIDWGICIIYIVVVAFFIDYFQLFDGLTNTQMAWYILIVMLPVLFYDLVLELLLDGQSLGKKIRKIKVICVDGTSPSLGKYLIRWIVRLLENFVFPGMSFVAVMASNKGQRLGDIAAGTAVAKVKSRVQLNDTILNYSNDGYTPKFPQVQNLSSRDIEVIRYVLKAKDQSNIFLIRSECARKVCSILHLDYDPLQDHGLFLQRIFDDYTFYRSQEL